MTALHLGTSPLERALGLAHGQQISAPGTQFLVFDHLTPEGTETLNRSLFMDLGGSHEVVVVQGYGLWRFGLMLALCYALTLYLSRQLLKLQVRLTFHSGFQVERNHRLLLATLTGIGASFLGLGNVAPTLFALAFLRVLVLSNQSWPCEGKVESSVELLDTVRAFWTGWLIPAALTYSSAWKNEAGVNMWGLLLGFVLSYLLFFGIENARSFLNGKPVRDSLIASFEFGCLETLTMLFIVTASHLAGPGNLAGTATLIGGFGFARAAQAILLRRLCTMPICPRLSTRLESLYRVATGVWFLLPIPLAPFFQGYDHVALMVWLSMLVPLATAARPWGSLAPELPGNSVNTPASSSVILTPIQKTAILFMSLPPEQSAQLFRELSPEEVQAVTLEITKLPRLSGRDRMFVVNEFLNASYGQKGYGKPDLQRIVQAQPEKTASQIKLFCGGSILRTSAPKPEQESASTSKRRKKLHICTECEEVFHHGIGLRKHQRINGHKGSRVVPE